MTSNYEAPSVTVVGKLEELTAAHSTTANYLDQTYPTSTPRSDLRFSG